MFYLQTLHLIAWSKIYFNSKKQWFFRFDLWGHFEVILGHIGNVWFIGHKWLQKIYGLSLNDLCRICFQTSLHFTVKDLFSSGTGDMYLFQNIQKSSQAEMHRNGICIAPWFESSAKSWHMSAISLQFVWRQFSNMTLVNSWGEI